MMPNTNESFVQKGLSSSVTMSNNLKKIIGASSITHHMFSVNLSETSNFRITLHFYPDTIYKNGFSWEKCDLLII